MKVTLRTSVSSREVIVRVYRNLLSGTAALVMFLMMAITLIDVLGRYLFSAPLNGSYELTELMLAAVIFLGLPLITADDGHIVVDILDPMLSKPVEIIRFWVVELVNVLAFSTFTWVLWEQALKMQRYTDTTAVLHIPLAWLAFMMSITTGLATIALIFRLLVVGKVFSVRGEQ